MKATSNVTRFAIGATVLAAILLMWKYLSDNGIVSPVYLPAPDRAFDSMLVEFAKGNLASRVLLTLEHIFFGWLIASVFGVFLGAVISMSRLARETLNPTLEFFRPLPAAALFPVAIAIFGLSEHMVLAVIGFGALWPTLLATISGFKLVSDRLIEVRQLLSLSSFDFVRKIALPNAMPEIIAGMRLSLTVALILSVTGEMLSSSDGLGYWIMLQARAFRSDTLFAGVMLFGAIGYLSAKLLSIAEIRLLRWRAKAA